MQGGEGRDAEAKVIWTAEWEYSPGGGRRSKEPSTAIPQEAARPDAGRPPRPSPGPEGSKLSLPVITP